MADIKLPYTIPMSGTLDPFRVGGNFEFLRSWVQDIANQVDTLSSLTVTGALGVGGAATLSSTLGVSGAATISSTLGVTGAASFSSNHTVTGTFTNTSKIITDASGNVVTVSQPSVSAYDTSLVDHGYTGSQSPLTLDGTRFNTGSAFDTGTFKFTCPVSGKYFVSFQAGAKTSGGTPATSIAIGVTSSNATVATYAPVFTNSAPSATQAIYVGSGILDMTAGDTLFLRGSVNSGASTWTLSLGAQFNVRLLG
jgi:hypothetical protein